MSSLGAQVAFGPAAFLADFAVLAALAAADLAAFAAAAALRAVALAAAVLRAEAW